MILRSSFLPFLSLQHCKLYTVDWHSRGESHKRACLKCWKRKQFIRLISTCLKDRNSRNCYQPFLWGLHWHPQTLTLAHQQLVVLQNSCMAVPGQVSCHLSGIGSQILFPKQWQKVVGTRCSLPFHHCLEHFPTEVSYGWQLSSALHTTFLGSREFLWVAEEPLTSLWSAQWGYKWPYRSRWAVSMQQDLQVFFLEMERSRPSLSCCCGLPVTNSKTGRHFPVKCH